MAEVALAVFLMLLLLTGKGYSQCFNNSDCTGDERSASDVRSCCVGTNDGLSYMDNSLCTTCIGELHVIQLPLA